MKRDKKEVVLEDLEVSFQDIMEAFDQKLLGDWPDIISKLSYQTQVLLLAIYQNISTVNQTVLLVSLKARIRETISKSEAIIWN